MGSLNNGQPITQSSGVLIARHTGHSIAISDYTRDGIWYNRRLTLPQAEPEEEYSGPPLNGLARWWSASSPLLSSEGDDVVYSVGGTPTIGEVHGLPAVKFTDPNQYYRAVSPILNTTDTDYVMYFLISRFDDAGATYRVIGGLENSNDENQYTVVSLDGSNDQAIGLESLDAFTVADDIPALDTAYVVAAEIDSANGRFRVGLNGSFGEWGSGLLDYEFTTHVIGKIDSGYLATDVVWVMDSLIYSESSYNQGVTDWLLARTS